MISRQRSVFRGKHAPGSVVVTCLFAIAVLLSAPCKAQESSTWRANALAQLYGIGEGIAAGVALSGKPSRIDMVVEGDSAHSIEKRTYIKGGLTVVLSPTPDSKAIIPWSVTASGPETIQSVSKLLSEMKRKDFLGIYGTPAAETESTLKYLFPTEYWCQMYIEFAFKGEMLVSAHWHYCAD